MKKEKRYEMSGHAHDRLWELIRHLRNVTGPCDKEYILTWLEGITPQIDEIK